MGKILQGVLGGFSGKVGPVVGGSWKGIDYMRGYVIPENPNSDAQQAVRAKFSALVALARSILPTVLQPFWDPFAVKMSGFNRWISKNYALVDENYDLDETGIMCVGTLEPVPITSAYNDGASSGISFSEAITGNGALTDPVYAVFYDKSTNLFYSNLAGTATRDDQTIGVVLPAGLTSSNLFAYLWASQGSGENFIVSDSDGSIVTDA